MSKLSGYIQDWLDSYGFKMGFCWDNYPPTLEEMNAVRRNKQDAKQYYDSKNI